MNTLENIKFERYPSPISIDKTEKILRQMRESVCRIYCGKKGTGFFTKINGMPVLITCNYVLNKEEIIKNREIKYSIGQEKKLRSISYNPETRKIYENKDLNFTIIEIKEHDNIDIINFLEIDEDLEEREKYSNHPIYVLGYPNLDNQVYVSYGIMESIKYRTIYHLSYTDFGSSGSPILSLKTFKIIGFHKGAIINKGIKLGLGSFIKDVMDKIFNKSKLSSKNRNLNEINIIYNTNNSNKIKIFGKEFVKNNINNCEIIYKGKEQKISEYFEINNNIKENGELEIILKETNIITNMSHLFSGCLSLIEIRGISQIDTKFVTNMSNIFNDCSYLRYLPDELVWDTNQITDMSCMFRNCSSLRCLPDISKWKTYNVTNLKEIFSGCESLEEIPDISKWRTSKVINMNRIFSGCSSLKKLPDISNWNTKEVTDMRGIFSGCSELKKLPDISNWNTGKVEDMSEMFSICTKLSELPDIYKWNTNNVKYMRGMFSGCQELKSIDFIYKWDTKYVIDMSQMFRNCINLRNIKDIYKWDVSNVKDMSYMFSGCKKLSSLPKISYWNVKCNTTKMFDESGIIVPLKFKDECTIY